jgi:hypothetical protein
VRRAFLAVGVVIVIILIALGVHSCQVSALDSSLKDYTNGVASVIQQSNGTGRQLFAVLANAGGQANATSDQTSIDRIRGTAQTQLNTARGLSVPDQVKGANQNLLLALRMRLDGITSIAGEIQPALGTSASTDAITAIAANTARLYASDVLYKDYVAPALASALHANGIAVGPPNGQTIAAGQFVPSVEWMTPSFVVTSLGATVPGGGAKAKPKPGLHGHALNSVSVGGTTLQTGSTNTITASPPPTFSLNFTNGGTNNETNVICKVSVTGTSDSGQTVVPETIAGKTSTCQVTLSKAPTAGTQTVVATIEPVPGEKNTSNNSLSFPVTFH